MAPVGRSFGRHLVMVKVFNIFQASPEQAAAEQSAPEQSAPDASRSGFDLDELTKQFRSQRNTDWSAAEVFLCLLLSAAAADGSVCREEQTEINALACRSRALKSLTPAQLATANAAVAERLKTRRDGLREACESLPMDMRLPIFAHCVDIVLSDGALLPIEADYLNRIASFMEIDPADGKRVLEVMLVKNRF